MKDEGSPTDKDGSQEIRAGVVKVKFKDNASLDKREGKLTMGADYRPCELVEWHSVFWNHASGGLCDMLGTPDVHLILGIV